MARLRGVLLFCLLVVASGLAYGSNAGNANAKSNAQAWYTPLVAYFRASQTPTIGLTEVKALPAEQWQPLGNQAISFGYDTTPYWFRFKLPAAEYNRVLQIEYPLLDNVQIFFIANEQVVSQEMGDKQPFYARPIAANGFVTAVPFAQEHEVYIRVATSSSVRVPIRVWQTETFHEAQGPRYAAIGLYFGVLLCMVVYNLFGYAVTRESSFFSYSVYVIFTGLLMAALSGIGFRYLWPNGIWLQERAITLFGGLAFVFATLFITQLLNLRSHSVRWHRGLVLLGGVAAGIALCSVFLPYAVTIRMLLPFAVFASAYVMVLGIAMWVRGMQHAQIFTLAWFAFLASIMLNSLGYLGIIDGQFIQRYAIMIGSGIEVLLLSWVVTLMYSAERTEKINAQDLALKSALAAQEAQRVLNEELEQRVNERTSALAQVTESLQQANAELARKNHEDGLTGLYNRRFFDGRIREEFSRSKRNPQPLALVLLDVDHFKQLNDEHGHQVGDEVLRQFAQRLRNTAARTGDAVCRYGGEEFAVILPATDSTAAQQVAQRLLQKISATPFTTDVGALTVTVSAGVATLTADMQHPEQLIAAADKALYLAKHQGRNQLVLAKASSL